MKIDRLLFNFRFWLNIKKTILIIVQLHRLAQTSSIFILSSLVAQAFFLSTGDKLFDDKINDF